jgi:PadR family transcriptional regulator PadR
MSENTTYLAQWTTQMRRGWLEACMYNVLANEALHGYGIMLRLQDIPGLGIAEGSLYPLLSRLRLQGLLAVCRVENSPDGPARKVYGLTPRGRQVLALMNDHFELMKRQNQIAKKRSAP